MLGPIGLAYLALNEGRLDDADALYRRDRRRAPARARASSAGRRSGSRRSPSRAAAARAPPCSRELVGGGSRPDSLLRHEYERARGFVDRGRGDAPTRHFARSIDARRRRRQPVRRGPGPARVGRAAAPGAPPRRRPRPPRPGRSSCSRPSAPRRSPTGPRPRPAAAGGQTSDEVVAHRLLTPHELQIARLVVGGASTRDVAAKLFISPRTIEAHLSTIFRKLGVRNRGELAARALDDPVLQP